MSEIDYGLTEEQLEIRSMLDEFGKERVVPVRAELDEKGIFPADLLRELAQMDLMGLYIDEDYGGMGSGHLAFCLAVETLSKYCIGVSISFAANALGADPIIIAGTEEQKKKYLSPLASGEKWAAFGLTEPNAGSDAGGIATTAVQQREQYIQNGNKQWITNGGEADIYTILASTDKSKGSRGISCFIVEKGTPGFEFGKKEDKLGIRASVTRELIFQDCEIPAENMVGEENSGFRLAMKTLDISRPAIAAQGVGLAQGALDEAVRYAKVRHQFGKPIVANQGLQWMLADMAIQVESARALTYAACRTLDSGRGNPSKISAMCKCYAGDAAMAVAIDAVQVLGGYGFMKEYPVEKMMRDAKILQIYEGTNQVQRSVVAANLVREYS